MRRQQRSRQDVHAVLVEETQEFRLLGFLEETTMGEGQRTNMSDLQRRTLVVQNFQTKTSSESSSVSPAAAPLLTLVDASMFSGSMSVLSSPISWTAPPNSGSESQIICLITTLISRTSWKTGGVGGWMTTLSSTNDVKVGGTHAGTQDLHHPSAVAPA